MRFILHKARTTARHVPAALTLALGLALAGCASAPDAGGPMNAQASMSASVSAGVSTGATVAFESVDGPPPQVFDRWVNLLDSEARLRNLAVASRNGNAAFRVRAYLAAEVRGRQTVIAWVWDVYDSAQQRALRLSGEEPATGAGRDAWASADDLVLRRIAQAGLTGLAAMINGTDAPAPAVRGTSPAIALGDAPSVQASAFAEPDAAFSPR